MDGLRVVRGRVVEVDSSRSATLPHRMLDAQAGGPVVTLPPAGGEHRGTDASGATALAPRDSWYRVTIELDAPPLTRQMSLARVVIDGESQAWLPTLVERVLAVLVRESGF
jgi:hypothetical protein